MRVIRQIAGHSVIPKQASCDAAPATQRTTNAKACTAEGISRGIYAHGGFTRDAALQAFGDVKRKTR